MSVAIAPDRRGTAITEGSEAGRSDGRNANERPSVQDALRQRLVARYRRPGTRIVDLTDGDDVAQLRDVAAELSDGQRLLLIAPVAAPYGDRGASRGAGERRSHAEWTEWLVRSGFRVDEVIGIPPPADIDLHMAAVRERYGDGAVAFYREIVRQAPVMLLDHLSATATDDGAQQILYVCTKSTAP